MPTYIKLEGFKQISNKLKQDLETKLKKEIKFNTNLVYPFNVFDLLDIEKEAFSEEFAFDKEDFKDILKYHDSINGIMSIENKSAGYFTSHKIEKSEKDKDVLYLSSIAVKPEYQGNNIGKTLMELLKLDAYQKNCKSIELHAFNNPEIIKKYQAMGFEIIELEEDYYLQEDEEYDKIKYLRGEYDAIRMSCDLEKWIKTQKIKKNKIVINTKLTHKLDIKSFELKHNIKFKEIYDKIIELDEKRNNKTIIKFNQGQIEDDFKPWIITKSINKYLDKILTKVEDDIELKNKIMQLIELNINIKNKYALKNKYSSTVESYLIAFTIEELDEYLDFAKDKDLIKEYKHLLDLNIEGIKYFDKEYNYGDLRINNFFLVRCLKTIADVNEHFPEKKQDFIEIIENNYQMEHLHLDAGLGMLIKNLKENKLTEKQKNQVINYLKTIKKNGSAIYTISELIEIDMRDKKFDEFKLILEYIDEIKELNELNQFTGYCSFSTRLSKIPETFEKYKQQGIENKYYENIQNIKKIHKIDLDNKHLLKNLGITGIEYFLYYPEIYEKLKDKSDIILDLIIDIKKNLTNYNTKKITKGAKINDFLYLIKEGKITYENMNSENKINYIKKIITHLEKDQSYYSTNRHLESIIKLNEEPEFLEKYGENIEFICELSKTNINKNNYEKIIEGLNLLDIFNSDLTPTKKKQLMNDKLVIGTIINDLKYINDHQWYSEITKKLNLKSINATKKMLKEFKKSQKDYKDKKSISEYINEGINIDNIIITSQLKAKTNINDLSIYKNVLDSDLDRDSKIELITKFYENKKYFMFLEPDTLDFDDWLERAENTTYKYLDEEYGLSYKYPSTMLLSMVNSVNTKDHIKLLKQTIEYEGGSDFKIAKFQPGKQYGSRKFISTDNLDFVNATKYLIFGIIGQKEEKINLAKKNFTKEIVEPAREFVSEKIDPKVLYRFISKDFKKICDNNATEKEKKIASKNILQIITRQCLDEDEYSNKRFQLLSLLRNVETLYSHTGHFNEIRSIMQKWNLEDLYDGKRLGCCAFISEDKESTEIQSLIYHHDPYIALQHIVPFYNDKPAGLPIGVSILVNCYNKNNEDVLLLDSAEGGSLLRNINEKTYLSLVLEGLVKAAQDSNSKEIIVSTKGGNGVAKRFIKYFKIFSDDNLVDIHLTKIKENPLDDSPRFLEAFKDRNKLSEVIPGYSIRTDQAIEKMNKMIQGFY